MHLMLLKLLCKYKVNSEVFYMEAFCDRKSIFHKIFYDNKNNILKENETMLKSKLLVSPVSGIVKKIDSNNAEIIIKTYDGYMVFLYLNERILKNSITSFIEEGSLIFKGDTIFNINCGYEKADLVVLKLKGW